MNVMQDKIHPMLLPFCEEVRIDDNLTVAIVSFPQGISKPYVVRHQGREEIFIRVGSTSRLATREQQMRLFEIGGMLHTEVMPVPRTDISSLDEASLLNYLRDILRDPDIPETQEQWQQRLLGLSFLTQAGEKGMIVDIKRSINPPSIKAFPASSVSKRPTIGPSRISSSNGWYSLSSLANAKTRIPD